MEQLQAIRHNQCGLVQVESTTFTVTFPCSVRGLRLCERLVASLVASKSEISCWVTSAVHTQSSFSLPSFRRPSWKKALRLARRRCPSPRKDTRWVQGLLSTPLPFLALPHAAETTGRVLHFMAMCLPASCQRRCASTPSPARQLQRLFKCRVERNARLEGRQHSQALAKCGAWDRWMGPDALVGRALRAHQQRWRFRSVLSLLSPLEMQLWAALVESVSFLLEFRAEFRWRGDQHSLHRTRMASSCCKSLSRSAFFLVVFELHRWIPVRSALVGHPAWDCMVDMQTGKETRNVVHLVQTTRPHLHPRHPFCALCVDLGQDNSCLLFLSFLCCDDDHESLFLDVSTGRTP